MSPKQDGPQNSTCSADAVFNAPAELAFTATRAKTLPPSLRRSSPSPPIESGSEPPQPLPNLSQSDEGEDGASKFATFKPSPPIGSGSDPPQLRKDETVPKGPPEDDQPTRRREDEPESIDSGESGRMRLHDPSPCGAEPPPSPKNAFPRELLAKFEPIEELGAGGMGVVWLVRHRVLKEERAGNRSTRTLRATRSPWNGSSARPRRWRACVIRMLSPSTTFASTTSRLHLRWNSSAVAL